MQTVSKQARINPITAQTLKKHSQCPQGMDGRMDSGRADGRGDFLPSLRHHHHRYLVPLPSPRRTSPHRTVRIILSPSKASSHRRRLIPIPMPMPDSPCIHTSPPPPNSPPTRVFSGRQGLHTSSIMDKVPSAPEDVTVNNNFAFPLSRSRYAVSLLRWPWGEVMSCGERG